MDYMKRALYLAQKGRGYTSPNPIVGAVIVKDGKIIGEGWHEKYGGNHAEINAFKNAKENIEGAEMYVTLEPCSHYGKTPPCALAIVEHKIKKVYIGTLDPNPLVAGKGVKILKDAGIEVVVGINEKECKEANEIFFKYITKKEPFVVMKIAMTLDGKIASFTGNSKWITCDESRKYVHKMRSDLSAIMVGINTVITDNPFLTSRLENSRNPIRIIVDSNLRIPENSNVLNINNNDRCIIATTENVENEKKERLKNRGIEIIQISKRENRVDLKLLMKELGKLEIDSILLEGGGTLNFAALNDNIVDKVVAFIAPKIIGGYNSKTPVEGKGFEKMSEAIMLKDIKFKRFNDDIMISGKI